MKELVKLFKALSDDNRIRILNLLLERDCCVCEVVQALSISQTMASRGLTQLFEAGLLEQRREGLWTIYYLLPEKSQDYRRLIISAIENRLKNDTLLMKERSTLRKAGRLCPAKKQSREKACHNKSEPEILS